MKSVDEEKIRSGTCKPFVYSTIPFTNKVALADKVPVFSYVDGRCPIIKSLPNRLLTIGLTKSTETITFTTDSEPAHVSTNYSRYSSP